MNLVRTSRKYSGHHLGTRHSEGAGVHRTSFETNDGAPDILEHLRECADSATDLNIYDIVSFYHARQLKRNTFDWQLAWATVRASLTFLTHLFVVVTIWIEDILWHPDLPTWYKCEGPDSWYHMVMSALLILVISMMSYVIYQKDAVSGLNRVNRWTMWNKPAGFSPFWARINRFLNTLALAMALLTATFLIWKSDAAIDIVKDCCAIYFILEIDEECVTVGDYKDLKEYLEVYGKEPGPKVFEMTMCMAFYCRMLRVLEISLIVFMFVGMVLGVFIIFMCPI